MHYPVKVSMETNCPNGYPPCEHLIWLRVPAAGNDGMLLGAVESRLAAETITAALDKILSA